jgi:hypothetical protein
MRSLQMGIHLPCIACNGVNAPHHLGELGMSSRRSARRCVGGSDFGDSRGFYDATESDLADTNL